MTFTEILIGIIVGMVITYSTHDRWCDWLKLRKERKEADENVRKL